MQRVYSSISDESSGLHIATGPSTVLRVYLLCATLNNILWKSCSQRTLATYCVTVVSNSLSGFESQYCTAEGNVIHQLYLRRMT